MVNHYCAMMGECAEILEEVTSEHDHFTKAKSSFLAAFKDLESCFKLNYADPSLVGLRDLAKERGDVYMAFKSFVTALVKGGSPEKESAKTILKVFDLYKIEHRANILAVTAEVRNFLEDLKAEDMQTALTKCGATFFYTHLGELNDQVVDQKNLCRKFSKDRVKGAMAMVRKKMDEVYNETVEVLQSLGCLMPGDFLEAVKKWNTVVDYYKNILMRREVAAQIAKKKEEEAKPTGKPTDKPADKPTDQPTGKPDGQPTGQPDGKPSDSQGTDTGGSKDPTMPLPDTENDGNGHSTLPPTPVSPEKTSVM